MKNSVLMAAELVAEDVFALLQQLAPSSLISRAMHEIHSLVLSLAEAAGK